MRKKNQPKKASQNICPHLMHDIGCIKCEEDKGKSKPAYLHYGSRPFGQILYLQHKWLPSSMQVTAPLQLFSISTEESRGKYHPRACHGSSTNRKQTFHTSPPITVGL